MPTFAGFFATQADCRAWLQQYAPEVLERNPHASTGAVGSMTDAYMKKRRIRNLFYRKTVPWPGASGPNNYTRLGLMLGRCYSEGKKYFAPDPERDLPLREAVEKEFGLKVSDWVVIWYSSEDPDMMSVFVLPEASEGA